MRGMNARKLVTLAQHRRRIEQAPPVERDEHDPSEAETTEVPISRDVRADLLEMAIETFLVPKLRTRTAGVEPLRTDFEERHRA